LTGLNSWSDSLALGRLARSLEALGSKLIRIFQLINQNSMSTPQLVISPFNWATLQSIGHSWFKLNHERQQIATSLNCWTSMRCLFPDFPMQLSRFLAELFRAQRPFSWFTEWKEAGFFSAYTC